MPLWFRHIIASLKLPKAQLHPFPCFPGTDMRHGGCDRMEIQTEFSTLSNLTEDLVQLSAPRVATSGKSKISPHSKSQERLCSRKGLRRGTVQLAGIRDRNCSTKGARKLNGSPNLMPQQKGRRPPTPQFQTKEGENPARLLQQP